jgi:uncharacterized protein
MKILEKIKQEAKIHMKKNDPAHDFEHIMRVYSNAKKLSKKEHANEKLVLCAVLLHDIVSYPKSDKRSRTSSTKSAIMARKILQKFNFTENEIKIISDAIKEHSYSKNKIPKTLEGKILQDSDRLDAIGAIGIARAFSVGGTEKRTFYNIEDPFCYKRKPNDKKWTLDHFYRKLLFIESKLNTKSARIEARRRTKILKKYLSDLASEI